MPRGGKREGAGKKSSWKSGCRFEQTKLIRVPVNISHRVLEVAHWLDEGYGIEKVTKSEIALQCEMPLPKGSQGKDKKEIVTNSKLYSERGFVAESGQKDYKRKTVMSWRKKFVEKQITEDEFSDYLKSFDSQGRDWGYLTEKKKYYLK